MTSEQLRTVRHMSWVLSKILLAAMIVGLILLFAITMQMLWGE